MDRRAFIAGMSGGLLAAPLAAGTEPSGKVYKIGFLTIQSSSPSSLDALYQGLREHGWVEGKTFVVTPKFAQYRSERLPELVAELVQLKVDVMVVSTAEAALAAKHGAGAIPIVAVDPADAVAIGLVDSLARPGGNVTGLSYLGTELLDKQMELLKEAVTTLSRVAVLTNPANPTHSPRLTEAVSAAQRLGIELKSIQARSPSELAKVFGEMTRMRVGGILVLTDPMFGAAASQLARLAAKHRLPAMYGLRGHVIAGGLISYGVDFVELYRRAATYVDKILKGAKPADLPVEQPTKFELVINLKTAKALGLTIPPALLQRADQVIE